MTYVDPPKKAEGVVVTFDRAEIKPDSTPGYFVVRAYFSGVDRPEGTGFVVKGKPLAERLKRAMEAGVVHTDLHALFDRNGKTFASHRTHVLARMMNADLKRLGF